jgi:hypothetical protein
MMLPEKVTPPIRIDSRMVMDREQGGSPPCSAAQPTSRLATPPEPLNSATISGIEVMATRWRPWRR